MWTFSTPWYEIVLRATCVFFFVFVVFRIWGKKHFGQLSPFDLVLLLIISECCQNALISDDKSVSAGFTAITTLTLLNTILNKAAFYSRRAERLIDGEAAILIKDGVINRQLMCDETITDKELAEALRQEGVLDASEVRQATLESDGKISVVRIKNS